MFVGIVKINFKDDRVPSTAVAILFPVLMDRLAESPGEHLHSIICQALVRMVVTHPSTDGVAKVRSSACFPRRFVFSIKKKKGSVVASIFIFGKRISSAHCRVL